jgi:hypothetical protein
LDAITVPKIAARDYLFGVRGAGFGSWGGARGKNDFNDLLRSVA